MGNPEKNSSVCLDFYILNYKITPMLVGAIFEWKDYFLTNGKRPISLPRLTAVDTLRWCLAQSPVRLPGTMRQ
ncbi:hypothetical protein A3H03_01400 [Candidatus Kuenenbacteria bacterium RIFCSPLOWO2_12_FULL_42_13]|uniref:Uncharacterized protein n=3 Tax=Candidatus Kueneniibacteriota TaxID=1752740 RepID=A0A1F6G2P5_9BACT|nr:MAG: hypothetical protein A3C68_00475 [Candidatus Kuenenbacteria bacterium RIFCSPHIGHO2_02_FULL_42_29]OGG91271.1 MAG: hypothetical protein A3H55_02470 [Candidatus Kuenenbacteria bacterium RIFCSPLOWO2_02_FULL_42_16]OGG92383.1 MAG: hypothetical protein A3H03_01400 [Candidatus Kuenenbacteria bacterium RIFCSPLOWO2_12_FULL_42_13]OGG95763.1 MAG: hypothetical protein A2V95_00995 [Candidatus Kuenenbacteria bacterium RBG_16_41_7]